MQTTPQVWQEAREKRLRQIAGVGGTPLLEIDPRLAGDSRGGSARILAKYEGANPGGSVKDRVAQEMILTAVTDPAWSPERLVLEASSGNTALGVARIASLAGLKARLYVPESAGSYRISMMRMLGAEVVLTPAVEGTEGAQKRAADDAGSNTADTWFLEQHLNPANPISHFAGTGPEIATQLSGTRVDAVVGSVGTAGTLWGVSGYLRASNPGLRSIPVIPATSSDIPGMRRPDPGQVPLHRALRGMAEPVEVELDEALHYCRYLALNEGILAGPSSGAAVAAAVRVAGSIGDGGVVVVILPDHARNYPDLAVV